MSEVRREVLPIPDVKHVGVTTYVATDPDTSYDGGGVGKGGAVTLYLDGDTVGEGRVERTHWGIFSMDETTEVGSDAGAPVADDYGPGENAFNGKVTWVQIDIDGAAEGLDHLISPEGRFRLAMAKQ